MSTQIRFYNPREASPELLEAMLVGREGIVQEVLDDLARQATSSSRQHWLIRGPRGIGKTHLVGILYHRLKNDEQLAKRFLPVWLAETDAYSAYSAAVLLLQIADRLVEELRLAGDPGTGELTRKLEELTSGGDDPALFEEVCEILREEAKSRSKILVILMENLDALLASLPRQRGAQEVRRLRSLLSQDKELLFISTTPTRYLAAVSDPKQPLYGHLKERSLQALTEDEVGQLLERLAEVTGQAERLAPLQEKREGRVRRRVLHRLSGGNPRAVVMAFTVLSGAPGVQAMVEEMSALLDTQTAYFEARLAHLAPRERAIISAMALSRKNLTLLEVAGLTRLPLRSLSVQIDRLREQGFLSMAAGDGGKGTIYEVSDGLFRVWYQYRKGRKVLQPIVQFLALWYPDEELENTLLTLREMGPASLTITAGDLSKLVEVQILEALSYSRSEEGQIEKKRLWSARHCSEETYVPEEIINLVKQCAENPSRLDFLNESEYSHLRPSLELALASHLTSLGRFSEAELYLKEVLEKTTLWKSYDVSYEVSMSLSFTFTPLIRAEAFAVLGRLDEADKSLEIWAETFSSAPHVLDLNFLIGVISGGFSLASAETALRKLASSSLTQNAEAANLLLSVAHVLKAETTRGSGRRASARARRQEALAQVPPELRSAVDEIAQKVRAARKSPLRIPKKIAPAGPAGALPL